MLTTRDRPILTQKTIESLHVNSTQFCAINIYVFDNYSDPTIERFGIFSNLLQSNKICYYSYDTKISSGNCFPKIPAHRRWRDMMLTNRTIRLRNKIDLNIEDFYLLIDNDMLVGPGWDEYFISVSKLIESRFPTIHFIIKWPGGVSRTAQKQADKIQLANVFNSREKIMAGISGAGGSSGFWFMTHNMLSLFEWSPEWIMKTYNRFKQHDTLAWALIRSKHGVNAKYVAGVIPPNEEENPLVIHLGGKAGSICNALTAGEYQNVKGEFNIREKDWKNLSAKKLFQKYKHIANIW